MFLRFVTRVPVWAITVAAAATFVLCSATFGINNPNEPSTQYANIAPLPGAGSALNSDGQMDGLGALQINIPVAYTPGQDYVNIGIFGGNHINEFGSKFSNGSEIIGMGFGKWPRFYASGFAVSSLVSQESKAINGQLQVVKETSKVPAIAFGVQDALNKENDEFNARAFYGVATKTFQLKNTKLFGSLGFGGGRFLNSPFGGVSVPLGNSFNAAIEYDGFQMNEAVAWRPSGRYGNVTVLGGYNNKAGMLGGATFVGHAPTLWLAIPVYLLLKGYE